MFKEYTFDCPGGSVKYELKNESAIITGYSGRIWEAVIPETLSECPVKEVAKKAFLGAKALGSLTLPSSIEKVGDWAFSACSGLENFSMAGATVTFGQGCFSRDDALKKLDLFGDEGSAHLLAAAATVMNAEYLLGEKSHFYEQWDAKLMSVLNEPDDEGFVFMVLCGEEDLTADIDVYKEDMRKKKASLAFLRLIFHHQLSDGMRDILSGYLKSHTVGCESDAAFKVILEHSEDERYTQLMQELSLVNDDNFEMVLALLGDRYAPLKAGIIAKHEESRTGSDFFDCFNF